MTRLFRDLQPFRDVKLFRDVDGDRLCPRGSVVCIGAFDGLHLGHQALVGRAVQHARELGIDAVALSFEPLPREFFAGAAKPSRLSLPRAKFDGLRALGVDRVGLLRFDARMAALSAQEFIEQVLVRRLAAREVWVGPEFRFGHGRAGDIALLRAAGETQGFVANEIVPTHMDDSRVSSSMIRSMLAAGDLAGAERLLGRRYAIAGRVQRGQQLGRKLGYPTANLRLGGKMPALGGIFATRVHGVGIDAWPSVSSLGTRPTVNGTERLLEAHLFDFDGDLYGQRIEVEFIAKLRDELRFDDLDALTAQMHRDAVQARAILGVQEQRRGAIA
ncbi:MAG TPA: bifunctional riboflavin kinase/FAD synthetase [Xanthomonadaceae bacterium]|jgi:riboflavin kinase/FMN adenylyltransferase|nr:bifunctional riboflavin kinase/FAD synthetase [Xanthomonadaceae bacterium]